MVENEMTTEQKAQLSENIKKTLESKLIQDALATNFVLSNQNEYGSKNVESAKGYYDSLVASKDFTKEADEEYQQKVENYRKMGIFGEPSRLSNGDLSAKLVMQFNEVTQMATLEELLAGVKGVYKSAGAKLEQETLPDEIKNYTYIQLIEAAEKQGALKDGKLSIDKLGDNEKNVSGIYSLLVEAYKEACIQKVCSPLAGYSKKIKEICDTYTKGDNLNQ